MGCEDCYCADPPDIGCVCCWIITVFLVFFALGIFAAAIWAMATYL